jgi:hypothetical protein
MTDKDDTGKRPQPSAETPAVKRPHATLDLKATEVGGGSKPAGSGPQAAAGGPGAQASGRTRSDASASQRLNAALSGAGGLWRANGFLSHVAAGVAGALVVLLASLFTSSNSTAPDAGMDRLLRRVVDVETALKGRAADASRLTERIATVERSVSALSAAQAKTAADTKALADKAAGAPAIPGDLADRVSKLETALAASPAADASSDALKAGLARLAAEQANAKSERDRLAQRLDALKSDMDGRLSATAKSADVAPLVARLTGIEGDLQKFLKSEGERNANAARVVLSLELADLKRAMNRGDPYATELDAVKKVNRAGLNLAPLERYALEGAPNLPTLTKEFRTVADAMIDAESEPPNAGIVDRLLTSARSIVRVRKVGSNPDDTGVEAVVGRMEAALKGGHLGDVLAESKKLPPKAALAGEDWLKQVQARYTVDQALAEIDAALRTSLAGTGGKQ